MNKIFKSKWNVSTQSWVACSEVSKNKGKISSVVTPLVVSGALSLFTPLAMADANWSGETFIGSVPASPAFVSPTDPNTYNMIVDPSHVYTTTWATTFHRVAGNKTFNYIGDLTAVGITSPGASTLVGVQYNKTTVNFEGNVDYTASSVADTTYGRGGIIGSNDASTINFKKNTVVNSNYNYASTNISGGVYHIGVLAGSSVNTGNDTANSGQYASAIFNNLTMNLTDSSQGGFLLAYPVGTFGIRAIQGAHDSNTGTGSSGYVEVKGDLKLDITADRAIGIYVSGNRYSTGDANGTGLQGSLTPKVVLNNSTITLRQSTTDKNALTSWDSHAIKLGKVRNTGEGAGILESHGKMVIDTTEAKNGGGIKLLRNSQVIADYDGSSTEIKTNGYALEIGGHDDLNFDWLQQAASHGVIARFKDAVFTTTGTSKDPSVSGFQARKDLIFVDQGQVGTQISFSGDKTDLTANSDGYIINVSGNYQDSRYDYFSNTYDASGVEGWYEAYEGSSVTLSATDAGSMTGLVSKGSVKTSEGQALDSSKTPTLNLDLSNGFTWNLSKKGSETTALFDKTTISSGAVINGAYDDAGGNEYTLQGDVESSGGVINLDNASHAKYNDILTISGNYSGSNNALVKMNTLWNAPGGLDGEDSTSDKLIITGNASGSTKVVPVAADGTTAIIDGNVQQVESVLNTIPVVEVQGSSATNTFTGVAKTTGQTEVQLASRQNATTNAWEYYWTMKAKDTDTDIIDPSVPGYVLTPRANMELGYTTLGTLHERRGENQTLAWDECGTCGTDAKGQSWARLFGKHLEQDGKNRFGMETDIYGVQLGHDFKIARTDEGGHRLTGGYFAYGHSTTDFNDRFRAENGIISTDKFTGDGKTDAYSLGLTHTRYAPHGGYVDLVGQVSYLRNKYNSRDGAHASQNGYGFALSAEVGRPYALSNHKPGEAGWLIEPQAQLIYQYLNLKGFNDGVRHVDQGNQDGLRGRIGVRLAHNAQAGEKNYQTNTFYAVANVWQDFIKSKGVNIGADNVREKYAQTWWEVGVGGQLPVGEHTYLYADARYERDFGSTKREGYRGTVGIKHTWK